MSAHPFVVEVLGPGHDRASFASGTEPLDRYLREQATQDVRRRLTACYVAVERATRCVAGYYTLAAGGVAFTDLPPEVAKKLPRYPSVPVARLGRLAVDRAQRGRGLGGALLRDAAQRVARSELAAFALVVDAKDEAAAAFYAHHGFVRLASLPNGLFAPLAALMGRN